MAHTYTACIKAAKAIATRHTYKQQLKLWPCTQKNQRRHSLKFHFCSQMEASKQTGLDLEREQTQCSPATKEAAQTEWRAFPPSESESSSPPDSASRQTAAPEVPRLQTASRRGWPAPVGNCPSEIRRMKRALTAAWSSGIILSLSKERFQGSDRTTLLTLLCKHPHHRTDGNRNSRRLALENSHNEVLGSWSLL